MTINGKYMRIYPNNRYTPRFNLSIHASVGHLINCRPNREPLTSVAMLPQAGECLETHGVKLFPAANRDAGTFLLQNLICNMHYQWIINND